MIASRTEDIPRKLPLISAKRVQIGNVPSSAISSRLSQVIIVWFMFHSLLGHVIEWIHLFCGWQIGLDVTVFLVLFSHIHNEIEVRITPSIYLSAGNFVFRKRNRGNRKCELALSQSHWTPFSVEVASLFAVHFENEVHWFIISWRRTHGLARKSSGITFSPYQVDISSGATLGLGGVFYQHSLQE